jgi:drug/metabolite transporter (DMT)-like permease
VSAAPRAATTAALTALAMLAFAANSLLCRSALAGGDTDAASFTLLRLASGAIALWLLARARGGAVAPARAAWGSALALFLYALLFSLAYLRIPAGVGALLLFAAVQLTMLGAGLASGERPHALEWLGLALSIGGLGLLTRPGLARPDPLGAALMLGSGAAWGVYSLRGRRAQDAVAANAASFARSVPLALAASAGLAVLAAPHVTPLGALLAVVSGGVTSGLGYAVWYQALPGLTATRAAIVQLSVPPLAALGGVAALGETLSLRLAGASALILGGIALAIAGRRT